MTSLLTVLVLEGCSTMGTASPRAPVEAPEVVLEVEVDARVRTVAAPAAWSARARVDAAVRGAAPLTLPDGSCQPPASPMPAGTRGPAVIELAGPVAGALGWDAAQGEYNTTGPRETVDPAWALGTLRWVDAAGIPRSADDVVRFGAVPVVQTVSRAADGSVRLTWDPLSVDAVEVHTNGPAGPLVCGSSTGGAMLPWWAVPAIGGEVLVRSVRERATVIDHTILVVTRAAIERVVPLDRPSESARESPRRALLKGPDRTRNPRRSSRPVALPTG